MAVIVYLGNRLAVDTIDGERVPVTGKRCTVVQPPEGIPLSELVATITEPLAGIWAAHSDGAPAWVAVASDDAAYGNALAQFLAMHYGCPIREPNPAEEV